jgi:hypothetical protein
MNGTYRSMDGIHLYADGRVEEQVAGGSKKF